MIITGALVAPWRTDSALLLYGVVAEDSLAGGGH
jgi:hypothetical protein